MPKSALNPVTTAGAESSSASSGKRAITTMKIKKKMGVAIPALTLAFTQISGQATNEEALSALSLWQRSKSGVA